MKTRYFSAPSGALASAVAASLFPMASLAQTGSPARPPQLGETIVTATRSEQLLSSALPHTTTITRQDIERSQASDLVTLLQREAGLQRTQTGGIGTNSSLFLRGAAALETLVLIDGIPQNKQDASGAVSLEHIMLESVERVEIVRGNVSAIYGSGAIGGVIQIFTRTGSRTPTATVSLELGPRSFSKLAGGVSASVGDTAFTANVSRLKTDGFSAINAAQQPGANPDADGYLNTSATVSATHRLSAAHNFGFKLFKSTGETAFDNAFGAPSDIQNSTTRLSQATLFTDNTFGNWRSRLSVGEQSDKSRYFDNGAFGSTDGFVTRATVLNWINTLALGGDWLLTAGLERQRQRIETTTDSLFGTSYDQQRNATAVFAGVEGSVAGGGLQVNVRNDKVGELKENTGYIGYGYPLTQQLKLIASASTAFIAPPLGYLFAPGFGNPLLQPELARSKELGLQYSQGNQLLRASWFDTRIKDQLNFDTNTLAFANISRSRNKGLELSYKGTAGQTDLRASLTLQDPTNEVTGQRLSRRAATLASVGVSQPVGALRLNADLQYSGARPDTYTDVATFATVDTSLPAYTLVNLSAAYKLSPQLTLNSRLDNATDRRYQTVYGYNQQPRSLYVGLSWSPRI
jgi:vitamin B12 transporter